MRLLRSLPSLCLFAALSATAALAGPRLVVSATASKFPEVVVAVHATTRDGKPVTDLTAADFTLFEDLSSARVLKVEQLRSASTRPVDITFVFDSTGSMQDEIDGLVRRARKFADMLVQSGLDYRLSLIPFGDEVAWPTKPTDNVEAFKSTLSALRANGGGDEPENQLAALEEAIKQPARPGARRVLVLITDATFHAHDAVTPLQADEVVADLRAAGAELHVVGPDLDQYKWMSAALGGSFFDKDSGEFEQLVNSLAGELAANYLVTYRTPRPLRDGTRRSVTLTAKHKSGVGEDASQYVAPALLSASSRQQGLEGDQSRFSPHFAIDGRADTAWVSDGTSAAEWLTFEFDSPQRVSALTVLPSADPRYAVPTTLELRFDDGSTRTVSLQPSRKEQTVPIDPPVDARRVQALVRAREPSSAPVAIAELSVGDGAKLAPELAKLRRSAEELAQAERTNRDGEKAYHAGKLQDSVRLYQQALERSPEFAQGWSNLGLSYWKLKRYADSVAANRQAIMLARRQGLSQVAANSYYSMGRTFEEQGETKQALQCMWWANQAVPKDVYRNAVDRLTKKIAEEAP